MHARRPSLALLAAGLLALTAGCGDAGSSGTAAPATSAAGGSDAPATCEPVAGDALVVLEDDQGLQTVDNIIPAVHAATVSGAENPLSSSPAFAAFQSGIAERCVDGPTPSEATVVGSFG